MLALAGGRGGPAPAASGSRPGGSGFRHPAVQGSRSQHGLLRRIRSSTSSRSDRSSEVPGVQAGIFPYSPTAAKVRNRSRLADSHMGIAFYKEKTCQTCHPEQAKDIHTVRANLTCRQCHGGEPIASIQYFNSPMNPIRKHAYVCAKCHEGASASFASYIVHEPAPGSASGSDGFSCPLLCLLVHGGSSGRNTGFLHST